MRLLSALLIGLVTFNANASFRIQQIRFGRWRKSKLAALK